MKVPIIILNYNTAFDCRKCISFLKKQQGIDIEIVVIDNCSSEDDLKNLRSLCEEEQCTLIENHENKGYNAGNNIGLRYAADKGYEYALIANPDMEFPQEDYLHKLVGTMKARSEVAVCGSNILGVNNDRQNPWAFHSFRHEFMFFSTGKRNCLPPVSGYCDILLGSCIMVRISTIKDFGYFDENVFLFCEEAILGKQMMLHKMKMYYLHEATAIHRHRESDKGSFIKRYICFWTSRWYYLKTYSGYNWLQLSIIYIYRKLHYLCKFTGLKMKGVS